MKKIFFWILVVIVVVILIAFASWSYITLLSSKSPSVTATSTSSTGFPITSSNNSDSSIVQSAKSVKVINQQGEPIIAKDFVDNGQTIPDTENPGSYLLAGSLGYCLPNSKCTAGSETDFNIKYDSTSQSFTIALLKEPIGQSRIEAEQFLMSTLGLTQQQMCDLNYYIGTTYDVNEEYDSSNLGFSFCPGAVQLPS